MSNFFQTGWKLSTFAITAMLGTFIGIFIVQRELNLTFVLVYVVIVALIVIGNAIYVLYKRRSS